MELLHAAEVRPEPGERVFRHGRIAPLFVLAILAAGIVPGAALLFAAAHALPWYGWILAGPFALVVGGLWLLVLSATAQVARRVWLPSSWSARLSASGLVLNLRSYQNAHFPHDGPTVVRLALREIARVRQVSELVPHGMRDTGVVRRKWLELELADVDTTVLERILRAERERPGPTTRFLGITSRTRFHHVPVHLVAPETLRLAVLRMEWLGRALPRELATLGVRLGEPHDAGFPDANDRDLHARVAALVRQGDRLGAITLARTRLGLTLRETKELVERLGREAA